MKLKNVEYAELEGLDTGGKALVMPSLAMLKHVDVTLEVRLGEITLAVSELFSLRAGAVLQLDRLVNEPVDVLLNGKPIATGQLAVMGEHLGVRLTEILNTDTELSA